MNFFGWIEVHEGRASKGGRTVGGPGGWIPPDAREVLKIKKTNEKFSILRQKLEFLIILMENFPVSKCFKFFRIFRENLGKNLYICIAISTFQRDYASVRFYLLNKLNLFKLLFTFLVLFDKYIHRHLTNTMFQIKQKKFR